MKKMIEAMKIAIPLLRNGTDIAEIILAAETSVPGIRRNMLEGVIDWDGHNETIMVRWELVALSDEAVDTILQAVGNARLADLLAAYFNVHE